MTAEEKIKIIEKTSLFQSLSYNDFCQIAEISKESVYEKGDIIFEENSSATAFFIIAEGEVEILKQSHDGKQNILAVKSRGEVFGEMSVIDDLPRSATIKAKTQVILLVISKNVFSELLKNFSHIAIEIARNIAYTVRTTNSNYISDLEKRNKQLKTAYIKLKSTQNELIRLEKLSVIGKFASLIIHDIKNPMSNIRAYAELIKMSIKDNPKVDNSTKVIMEEVDRLTQMTGELLEFARGEIHLNTTPVNLSSLMLTMIDSVKADLEKRNIKIIFNDRVDALVIVDSEKIIRVFKNLVNNAADALLSGGIIIIKLEELDKYVKWSIQDNGIGMTQEIVKKIFEPFYSYNKKGGTGLGMAIVKSIVDSHNGHIKVFTQKDKGTRFEILLPKI